MKEIIKEYLNSEEGKDVLKELIFSIQIEENKKYIEEPYLKLINIFKRFDIDINTIEISSNNQLIKDIRYAFTYWARINTSLSLKAIGRMLGRDHSTVIYMNNKVNDFITTKDKKFMNFYKKAIL